MNKPAWKYWGNMLEILGKYTGKLKKKSTEKMGKNQLEKSTGKYQLENINWKNINWKI